MKHVLVLTGRFLPQMSANGVCINNIIQRLPKSEFQVTCICYDDTETMQDDTIKIIRVSRVYRTEKKNSPLVNALKKAAITGEKICKIPFLISWPWSDPFYTRRVYRIAKELYSLTPFDYVIAVHMPISSLIVADKLKKKFPRIKYIPYFLDSLSGGRPISLFSEEWNRKKKLDWEKRLLPNADKIVVMESSCAHHEQYSSSTSYYNKFVYLDIPLLCKPEKKEYKNPFSENDKIIVTFSGAAVQPLRNMIFFSELAKTIHAMDPKIVFYIIGQSNCEKLYDPDYIRYLGPIAHENLLPYLDHSDILLNFGVRVPSAISGKIFEYMAFGKPIISTFSIENEACIPYLLKYPISLLVEENMDKLEKSAEEMLSFMHTAAGRRVEFAQIKDTFRNNLPETFIEEIFEKDY